MAGRQGWNLKRENRTFEPISGESHYAWQGADVTPESGRQRARYRYKELGACEACRNAPAIDRHHRDGDTTNNEPGNVMRVCRRCHMLLDGRLESLLVLQRELAQEQVKPAQPCENCGRPAKPRRKGRCYACDMFFRRHAREWTPADAGTRKRAAKAIIEGTTEDPRGNL